VLLYTVGAVDDDDEDDAVEVVVVVVLVVVVDLGMDDFLLLLSFLVLVLTVPLLSGLLFLSLLFLCDFSGSVDDEDEDEAVFVCFLLDFVFGLDFLDLLVLAASDGA